jgi:hypothetical protein
VRNFRAGRARDEGKLCSVGGINRCRSDHKIVRERIVLLTLFTPIIGCLPESDTIARLEISKSYCSIDRICNDLILTMPNYTVGITDYT